MKTSGTANFDKDAKNLSKCDWVVSEILSQISSGDLTPGDRLPPENDLATMFGVSRITIRESIKKLSMLDVVEVRRGDGSFVKQAMFSNIFDSLYPILMFENKTITEIYDVRAIIEGGAAYLAALYRTEADLEDLYALYRKMKKAVSLDDAALFSQYDIQFHIRIAEASQNAILKTITAVLHNVWADCIGKTNYSAPIISASHKAHNHLLDAISAQQQSLASVIMRSHICTAGKNLLQRMENAQKETVYSERPTKISLPYGSGTVTAELPSSVSARIISRDKELSQSNISLEEQRKRILASLDNPIGGPSLTELSEGISSLVIVTNDSTRYTPSNISIPLILERLYDPSAVDITILIATGLHRPMTQDEIDERFSKEIQSRCKIVNHDACDNSNLCDLGILSTGNHLFINKIAIECDLLIAEGSIEPHFFAGYTGGRKSILPGIAGEASILYNHRPDNIAQAHARAGNLKDNCIHLECTEAAARANLSFIVNYVLNDSNQVVRAFSGNPTAAYSEGCAYVEKNALIPVEPSDIVVISNGGQPLDLNLYQTVKGIETAAKAIKPEGIIIIASKCSEGVGSKAFEQLITTQNTLKSFNESMLTSVSTRDKWQAKILARVLARHRVILVSDLPPAQVKAFFITPASTLNEALSIAYEEKGRNSTINVFPCGPFIIPYQPES